MIEHQDYRPQKIRSLIRSGAIFWAGNKRNKIYGTLSCKLGKRIKKENRVFFKTEAEAILLRFRPCAHCSWTHYGIWKCSC
ncbi:MAG: metal-binding protein [Cyclobacteriaceae bacterium]|nr:metal-binding protein [Cyclobacteriaceae bacterium]MDH4298473.1 metal-binding protein [Cyclobacteriaceae bacterium]MDH5248098.1 metal-binding protein [Cyclobacteriaceae bacterium]